MNLSRMLAARAAEGRPVRVGLIGAGKFGTMFLAQARVTPGLHVVAIADLDVERGRQACARAGWESERLRVAGPGPGVVSEAARDGRTALTDRATDLVGADLEVVVEATGVPEAGVRHALAAFEAGRHVVMVNVEADALVGPALRARADRAGVVYSLAYGDQPALICEMVDWAQATGLEVVAAGKGTKYLPAYHASTPETVWGHYGFTPEQVASGDFNARMFNSFLDGTKSAIEMAAVANATGLVPQPGGLGFPPASVDDLPEVLRPAEEGGVLAHAGTVEVVSSLFRDGTQVPRDLRWGVYVVFKAPSAYARRCFAEYGLRTDRSGWYAAMYKPYHLIGLELGVSVASAALRREPTGSPAAFVADVGARAKRDLAAGETLDGEGGFTVYGVCLRAADSLRNRTLPLGLAHGVRLTRPVRAGALVSYDDVVLDHRTAAARLRAEVESGVTAGSPVKQY